MTNLGARLIPPAMPLLPKRSIQVSWMSPSIVFSVTVFFFFFFFELLRALVEVTYMAAGTTLPLFFFYFFQFLNYFIVI